MQILTTFISNWWFQAIWNIVETTKQFFMSWFILILAWALICAMPSIACTTPSILDLLHQWLPWKKCGNLKQLEVTVFKKVHLFGLSQHSSFRIFDNSLIMLYNVYVPKTQDFITGTHQTPPICHTSALARLDATFSSWISLPNGCTSCLPLDALPLEVLASLEALFVMPETLWAWTSTLDKTIQNSREL